jgi:hypothetical protein
MTFELAVIQYRLCNLHHLGSLLPQITNQLQMYMNDLGSAARTTVAVTMTEHHDRHFSPSLFSPANIDDFNHTQEEKG